MGKIRCYLKSWQYANRVIQVCYMVQLGINDANGDGVIPTLVVYQGLSLSEFRVTNLTLKKH